jgi:S-adenosylmethionine hydrolase
VNDRQDSTYAWIWLLTDYGRRDGFVAACRGVIAQIAPSVRVEDITHDVPAHDVRHGAAILAQTMRYLPPSVVVGVVDPGVGTSRRAIALAAGEFILVGPDNGLLLWAAASLGGASAAVELTEPDYLLDASTPTFAGRDVFAPAAAHLALGVPLAAFGAPVSVDDLTHMPTPRVEIDAGVLDTEVLTVDRFGNVQLYATVADLNASGLDSGVVQIGVHDRSFPSTVGTTFADVPLGDVVLFIDSARHVALAVNGGDAATTLDLRPGDGVVLTR